MIGTLMQANHTQRGSGDLWTMEQTWCPATQTWATRVDTPEQHLSVATDLVKQLNSYMQDEPTTRQHANVRWVGTRDALACVEKLYALDDSSWRRVPELAKIWNDSHVLALRHEWLTYWSRTDVSARHAGDLQECRAERNRQRRIERLAAASRDHERAEAHRQRAEAHEQRRREQRNARAVELRQRRAMGDEAYLRQFFKELKTEDPYNSLLRDT